MGPVPIPDRPDRCRLDKWLWHARFFRTRSQATAGVAAGHMRVNGIYVAKPAHPVGPGDTLTFVLGDRVRVIRITATAPRRGAAESVAGLYADLDLPAALLPQGPSGA